MPQSIIKKESFTEILKRDYKYGITGIISLNRLAPRPKVSIINYSNKTDHSGNIITYYHAHFILLILICIFVNNNRVSGARSYNIYSKV